MALRGAGVVLVDQSKASLAKIERMLLLLLLLLVPPLMLALLVVPLSSLLKTDCGPLTNRPPITAEAATMSPTHFPLRSWTIPPLSR